MGEELAILDEAVGDEHESEARALAMSDDSFKPVMDSLRAVAEESLRILVPVEAHENGLPPSGKYTPIMHARLCRMRMLGLSDAAAGKALGIHPTTLSGWKKKWPKLAADLETAAELGVAHAAVLLQGLMAGGGPTAFQAIRFYLATHSRDFAEKKQIEVTGDVQQTVRLVRSGLYGLLDDPAGEVLDVGEEQEERPAELLGVSVSGSDAFLPPPPLELDL